MKKVRIRHIGDGSTHPENRRPSMLLLKDYLEHGFDYGEDTGVDFQHKKGEVESEANWKKEFQNGI